MFMPDFLILFACMLVFGIYHFRLHQKLLLPGGPTAPLVQWTFVAAAVLGLVLGAVYPVEEIDNPTLVMLVSPAVHLFLFRLMFVGFAASIGRAPVDVDRHPMRGAADRMFLVLLLLWSAASSGLLYGLFKAWRA